MEQTLIANQTWSTTADTPSPSYFPSAYMLLLSAVNSGWQVTTTELMPSWDQHGFIYLVTLSHSARKYHQRLILPKNPTVESLLFEQPAGFVSSSVRNERLMAV